MPSLCLALLCAVRAGAQVPRVPPVAETRRQVTALLPAGQRLLTSGGSAQLYLRDLDGDGRAEVFGVTVEGADTEGVEELSRFARLFDDTVPGGRFRLHAFYPRDGVLQPARAVDLGTWKVLATLSTRSISRELPYPLAFAFVFQTPRGAEHVWVVYGRDPRLDPAHTVFHETLSTEVSALDVDGDGLLDVVTADREVEPAGRYETYLTWYRWTGREYREYASTVVVRNLARFLARTRAQLLEGAYDELIRDALEPGLVQSLRRSGLDTAAILGTFFPLAPDLSRLRDVVLPEIRDNPFRVPSEAPAPVALSLRVVDQDGISQFVEVGLAISRNPFQARQFSLLPAVAGRPVVDTSPP